MRKLLGLVVLGVILLTGCSAGSVQDSVARLCEDRLQYEIEQAIDAPAGGWLDSELSTSNVQAVQRDNDQVEAFDVSGDASVALANGRTVNVTWTCFGQRADGEDHATVMSINGRCSTAYTGNDPAVCTPR